AASIFSLAEAENACALTWTFAEMSPWPSTLTGWPSRTGPFATSSSMPTVPPSGKSSPRRSRFTTWNSTLNGFLKPLSFGSRMWSGIWPPSKAAGTWYRALEPLVPRPAVLPFEASPRPTRVLAVLAPGAGRRWCSFSVMSVDLLDRHQVTDGVDHAPDLRAVLLDDHVTNPLETERTQGLALVGLAADRALLLRDLEAHQGVTSARERRSAAGATSSTLRPRRAATASGSSSMRSASTVACTMLIWFDEPSDLLS